MIKGLINRLTEKGYKSFKRYSTELDNSDILTILKNERRMMAVDVVNESTAGVSMSGLAEAIAAAETGGDFTSADRKRVYISLYQVHIPKMDSMNIVDYDKDSDSITPTSNTKVLVEIMDAVQHING